MDYSDVYSNPAVSKSFDQQTVNTLTKTVRSQAQNEDDNKSTRTTRTRVDDKARFIKIKILK